jgi:hypothetical protein
MADAHGFIEIQPIPIHRYPILLEWGEGGGGCGVHLTFGFQKNPSFSNTSKSYFVGLEEG